MRAFATLTAGLAAALTVAAGPIAARDTLPAGYEWAVTNWVGRWVYIAINRLEGLSAPAAQAGDVTIPALELVGTCGISGAAGTTFDCNSNIQDNADGSRSITFEIQPFMAPVNGDQDVHVKATYQFKSGGSTYQIVGDITHGSTDVTNPISFTVTPTSHTKVA